MLHMPEGGRPIEVQSQDVVRFKGSLYYVNEPEPKPNPLQVSLGSACRAAVAAAAALCGLALSF